MLPKWLHKNYRQQREKNMSGLFRALLCYILFKRRRGGFQQPTGLKNHSNEYRNRYVCKLIKILTIQILYKKISLKEFWLGLYHLTGDSQFHYIEQDSNVLDKILNLIIMLKRHYDKWVVKQMLGKYA